MFKVFITAKALADTCLNEGKKDRNEQSKWFRILSRQMEIYTIGYTLNDTPYEETDFSDEAILYRAQSSLGFVLLPEDEFVLGIHENPESVLLHPSAAFYLDISPEEANKIQKEYGVICQSTEKSFDESCLTDESEVYDMAIGSKAIPWKNVLESAEDLPSNSLFIIDRYLFAYDGQLNKEGEKKSDGIYNVFFIMDNALPKSFSSTYHVTILCEQKEVKNKEDNTSTWDKDHFDKVSESLFKYVPLLKRDYPIIIEVIAFRKRAYFFNELTHTRQVISNYYRVSAENGLNTTNYSEGQASYYPQQLAVQHLYSSGLKRDAASTPADTVRRMHETYNKFLKQLRDHSPSDYYWYACNNEGLTYQNHENRLFI